MVGNEATRLQLCVSITCKAVVSIAYGVGVLTGVGNDATQLQLCVSIT